MASEAPRRAVGYPCLPAQPWAKNCWHLSCSQTNDTMPATITHENGAIYRLSVSGTLTRAELARCEKLLAAESGDRHDLRLLVVLNHFTGWAAGESWDDFNSYMTDGDRFERIAIVADDRWREQVAMFTGAGLRRAAVEFFVPGAISQAREWIAG